MDPADTGTAAVPAGLRVTVVCSPAPGELRQVALVLPQGASLQQALAASGLWPPAGATPDAMPNAMPLQVGVWGQLRAPDALLRDQDRVEIYRPLQVDPKEARRRRQQRQRLKR